MTRQLFRVLLILGTACQGDRRAIEAGMTPLDDTQAASLAATQPDEFEAFTPLELRLYERGRRAEIAALAARIAEPAPHGPLALDSIGATAAGLRAGWYLTLTAGVDSALIRGGGNAAAPDRKYAAPRWNGQARRLDSLRLERLVLVIRMTTTP